MDGRGVDVSRAPDGGGMDYLACQLKSMARSLLFSPLLSDLTVTYKGGQFPGHRVVFFCHGDKWGQPLSDASSLDWCHLQSDTAKSLITWVYTGEVDGNSSGDLLISLAYAASSFDLQNLIEKTEEYLVQLTNVNNCVDMFNVAVSINAIQLEENSQTFISANLQNLSKQLERLEPPAMCRLIANIHAMPLHEVVKCGRYDVLQQFVTTYPQKVQTWINLQDAEGYFPLELALTAKRWDFADLLLKYHAYINAETTDGSTYIQKAIKDRNIKAAIFLIEKGADIFCTSRNNKDTCLHLVAAAITSPLQEQQDDQTDMNETDVAEALLARGADPNKQNAMGMGPLHSALLVGATALVQILLAHSNIDLNIASSEGLYPIHYAIQNRLKWKELTELLITAGARVDTIDTKDRLSLVQRTIKLSLEPQALFLCEKVPKEHLDHTTRHGETALHLASARGMTKLVSKLLEFEANPNIQTFAPSEENDLSIAHKGYQQTCLHYAIIYGQPEVLKVILDQQSSFAEKFDCNLRDSLGNTPLSLAFNSNCESLVPRLIECGANVNIKDDSGLTLLHKAILERDSKTTLFLLNHGADFNEKTTEGNKHPLHLVIESQLGDVMDELCRRGVDLSIPNESGQCALWAALTSNQYDIASILVRNGADTDAWGPGLDGSYQTLLHAAINLNLQDAANFLIQSGCDVNTPQRCSPEIGGEEATSGWTPLHLCCQLGREGVVQTLLEHGASVNKKDAEGKTPLYLAIDNEQDRITELLLQHPNVDVLERDNRGLSPFAVAISRKCNKAASAIIERFPSAAEQFNKKGLNLLHMALEANELESVLFLLSINVDVNSITRDSTPTPPLHLAVIGGNEVIVRSLLLAGPKVNAVDGFRQTALHVAAAHGHPAAITALLSHECDADMVDSDGNNALHIACKEGQLASARTLLLESTVNAEAVNTKGQNPLHTLARYGKENAYAICTLITETISNYPLDQPDVDGNTALLIAYMKGNGNLCRSLVKAGACIGAMNMDGVTIFNYHVATKQLLYSLLEFLDKEPRWSEGDTCLECGTKFSLTMRRHHCRHCGRLVCSKCSDQDVPILKYKLNKPVRVCAVCFFVLQGGAA